MFHIGVILRSNHRFPRFSLILNQSYFALSEPLNAIVFSGSSVAKYTSFVPSYSEKSFRDSFSLSLVRLKCVLSVSPNSDLLARRRPRRRFLTVSKAPLGRRFLEELLCRLTFDLMIDAYKERAERERERIKRKRGDFDVTITRCSDFFTS